MKPTFLPLTARTSLPADGLYHVLVKAAVERELADLWGDQRVEIPNTILAALKADAVSRPPGDWAAAETKGRPQLKLPLTHNLTEMSPLFRPQFLRMLCALEM